MNAYALNYNPLHKTLINYSCGCVQVRLSYGDII